MEHKKVYMQTGVAAALTVAGGLLFRISVPYLAALCIATLLLSILLSRSLKRRMEQKRRYTDAARYLEKMLHSFQSSHKILAALENTAAVFAEGTMRESIARTIKRLQYGGGTAQTADEIFSPVEEEYGCDRVGMMHRFLSAVEEQGGEPETGIRLLLADRSIWVCNTDMFMEEKEKICQEITVGFLLSSFLCMIFLWLPKFTGLEQMDIHTNAVVQGVSAAFLAAIYFLYYQMQKRMETDWLGKKKDGEDELWQKRYERYESLGTKKLNDRLSRHILKNDLTREVKKEFPGWILMVALYMQQENVEVALDKSYASAPGVLKVPLAKMLKELDEDPNSMDAYQNFLAEFEIADVQEAMDGLYSIFHGLSGDGQEEFHMITERNLKMSEQAQRLKEEDRRARLEIMMWMTTALTSVVLIVYMAATLFQFFQTAF